LDQKHFVGSKQTICWTKTNIFWTKTNVLLDQNKHFVGSKQTFCWIKTNILLDQDKHFVGSEQTICFQKLFLNRAVYEKMWKIIVERGSLNMSTLSMRIACWIPKAIDTHSEYVINLVFPL
jgi:hypothetical protein